MKERCFIMEDVYIGELTRELKTFFNLNERFLGNEVEIDMRELGKISIKLKRDDKTLSNLEILKLSLNLDEDASIEEVRELSKRSYIQEIASYYNDTYFSNNFEYNLSTEDKMKILNEAIDDSLEMYMDNLDKIIVNNGVHEIIIDDDDNKVRVALLNILNNGGE